MGTKSKVMALTASIVKGREVSCYKTLGTTKIRGGGERKKQVRGIEPGTLAQTAQAKPLHRIRRLRKKNGKKERRERERKNS